MRSLVGVYANVLNIIRIDESQVIIPRLSVETIIRLDNKNLPASCMLRIIFETNSFVESELAKSDFEFDLENIPPIQVNEFAKNDGALTHAQMLSQIQIANVLIPESGRIKVRLSIGNDEIALGSLLVNIMASETPAT